LHRTGGCPARRADRSSTFATRRGRPPCPPASCGGVDVEGHTKKELYERAARLDVRGRAKMDKYELAQAIARKQD